MEFKVIDLGVNRKPMYDFLLVTNSNFGRICYRFLEILTLEAGKSLKFHTLPFFEAPWRRNAMRYQRNLYTAESAFNGLQFRR